MKRYAQGPTFLGIGPPKTATSWLYYALGHHPEVSLPPMKEIGYLWEKFFLPQSHFLSRFIDNHRCFKAQRRYIKESLTNHIRDLASLKIDRRKLLWDIHYSFFPHTDTWYSKLFDGEAISGDITPKYCELRERDVEALQQLYPNLKVIISLRDPVEREWSRAKMNLCKNRNRHPHEVPEKKWIAHFDNSLQSSASDYKSLIERWSKHFGKENVHIFFYEDLCNDGWEVLTGICQFLGISQPPESLREKILKPVNSGINFDIPQAFARYLFEKHKDKILAFANSFPCYEHPREWLRKREARIG